MILLILSDSVPGLLTELTINTPLIVSLVLQLFLNVHHHLVRRQIGVGIDWAIASVNKTRGISPGREPIAAVPIPRPPAAAYEGDVIMGAPPIMVMPRPVITSEHLMAVSPM